MFSHVTDLLDKSVDVAKLKDFLGCYSHPLYPEQPYVDPKIYKDASTTKQLIKSLFPQFINFMHYFLLEDIVEKFGCAKAKEVLKQYTDLMYSQKRKLISLPDPITDEEIGQFHGTKKLKAQVEGVTSDATVEIIGEIQNALEMATGVKRAVVVHGFYDPTGICVHAKQFSQPRQLCTLNLVKASCPPNLHTGTGTVFCPFPKFKLVCYMLNCPNSVAGSDLESVKGQSTPC